MARSNVVSNSAKIAKFGDGKYTGRFDVEAQGREREVLLAESPDGHSVGSLGCRDHICISWGGSSCEAR